MYCRTSTVLHKYSLLTGDVSALKQYELHPIVLQISSVTKNILDLSAIVNQCWNIGFQLHVVSPDLHLFSSKLKLRHSYKIPLQSEIKTIKNCYFCPNLSGSRHSTCIYWFWRIFTGFGGYFIILIRFLQRFKIVSHRHTHKIQYPFFSKFSQFVMIWMKIIGTNSKDGESIFRKKTVNETYTAHHELKVTIRIQWYSTGLTIYNWNPMFQHWFTMAPRSGH